MPPIRSLHSSDPHIAQTRLSRFQAELLRITLAVLIAMGLGSGNAGAQVALTPATATAGWTIATFAAGYTSYGNTGIGPLGIAFTDTGSVLVASYDGDIWVFPTDTDGQSVSNVPIAASYGGGNAVGLARIGSSFYMTEQGAGKVVQINADGTLNQTIATLDHATGITVNPVTGHLIVTLSIWAGVWDVDPVTKKATRLLILPYNGGDGLTTDGSTLYVESGGHIFGYRLSDKTRIFDSGYIIGADGCVLGAGSLSGYLFVNTNYGQVFQIDLATQVITLISTGGSRGDFVAMDPNGSILITLSGRIVRLTPPTGVSIDLENVSLNSSTVAGSVNVIGTVTLTNPAPIDMTVVLSSANTAASVPASATVSAGAISAPFTVTTAVVSAPTSGSITATLNGINKSATLIVRPIGVSSLTLKPASIKGGKTVTGTVTLEAPAAPAGITVTFTSSDSSVMPTPASVTIAAGQKSATFTVSTKAVTATSTVTLTATANKVTSSANLTVTP